MRPGDDCDEGQRERMRAGARMSTAAIGGRLESVVVGAACGGSAAVCPAGSDADTSQTRPAQTPAVTDSGHPVASADAGVSGATTPITEDSG